MLEFTPEQLCDEWVKGDLIHRSEHEDALTAAYEKGKERAAVIADAAASSCYKRRDDIIGDRRIDQAMRLIYESGASEAEYIAVAIRAQT